MLYGGYLIVNIGVTISRRTRMTPLIASAAAAVNLGLNFWAIPHWGIVGAGLTTVLGYALLLWWGWANAQRSYPVPYDWLRVGKVAAMAMLLLALSQWVIPRWADRRIVRAAGDGVPAAARAHRRPQQGRCAEGLADHRPPPAPPSAGRDGPVSAAQRPLRVLAVADARSIHTLRWARRLADRGHDVHIVYNRVGADPRETASITVHDLLALEPLMRVPRLRRLRFGPAIRRLAAKLEADIVHGHGITPYAYWGALAEVHPYVVSPWGRDVLLDALEEPGKSRALRTWRSADYLVVNSGAIEAAAVAAGADPARIAHIIWHTQLSGFGPEQADREGLRAELGWPSDALIVLSLRNFQERTNIDVLVRRVRPGGAPHPRAGCCWRLGGETRARSSRRWPTRAGDRIRLHRVDPDGLPRLAASGDIVVSIANTDSSPSSLLEAMASGNPLVGGWCPSIDEWIGPGEGAEMVQPRDEQALAAALDRLLADGALRERYAERNLRIVRERVAESAPAMEALYRRLISEHAERSAGPVS